MKAAVAIFVSLIAHVAVLLAVTLYLDRAPAPVAVATLDLSSVELSFAEEDSPSAAVASMPVAAAERPLPKPKSDEPPPEVKLEKPLPPEAGEIKFPEPKEEDVRLKTEDAAVEDERRETEDTKAASETQVAPRQARIDAPPKPQRNIRPDYPRGARSRGEQGDVVLEIRVSAEGLVDYVKVAVSSGFAELDEAAVKAAKAAKFSPARSGRDAVASTARLKLQFKLK